MFDELILALAETIRNFSKEFPLVAGLIVIIYVIRPFTKIGSTITHKKLTLSEGFIAKIKSKWYLRIGVWILDTLFGIKILPK